jgi:hypothetical protein
LLELPLDLLLVRASIPETFDPFRLLGGLCDANRASLSHSRSFTSFLLFGGALYGEEDALNAAGPPTIVVVVRGMKVRSNDVVPRSGTTAF